MATCEPEEFKTKSGKVIVLRPCVPDDVDIFLEFQKTAASETTHTLQVVGRVPDRAEVVAAWEATLQDSVALRLCAVSGGRMVAQLNLRPDQQPRHPWTEHIGRFSIMVLKEFWGEGIARRLLAIMEAHATLVGITRIEALVRTNNERGLRLYSRMGYEIEGLRSNAARINGVYHDEYFIAKRFNHNLDWRPPALETERILLRPLEVKDAASIFEYARNPIVSQFTLWEPHRAIADSEAFIIDYAFRNYQKLIPEPWGITLRAAPDNVLGTLGCFWVSKAARSMELAYAIGQPYWGRGLVVEASRAVIDHCLKEYDLNRIQARCKTENKASAKVMEKLGMQFEGTLKAEVFHRQRFWDMHYYALLRKDWLR